MYGSGANRDIGMSLFAAMHLAMACNVMGHFAGRYECQKLLATHESGSLHLANKHVWALVWNATGGAAERVQHEKAHRKAA